MASTPGRIRPWRHLAAFAGIIVALYALVFFTGDKAHAQTRHRPAGRHPGHADGADGGGRRAAARAAPAGADDHRAARERAGCERRRGPPRRHEHHHHGAGRGGRPARSLGQTAQLRFREVVGGPGRVGPHRSGGPRRPGFRGARRPGDTPSTVSPTGAPSDTPDSTLPPQGGGGPRGQHAWSRPSGSSRPCRRRQPSRPPGHTRPGRRYRGDPGGIRPTRRRRGDRRRPGHPPEHGRHRTGPGDGGAGLRGGDPLQGYDDPALPLVSCNQDGTEKYVLGPSFLEGTQIAERAGRANGQGAGYVINVTFKSTARHLGGIHLAEHRQAGRVRARLEVVSAPDVQGAISGTHLDHRQVHRGEAKELANTLRYGSLPLSFSLRGRDRVGDPGPRVAEGRPDRGRVGLARC